MACVSTFRSGKDCYRKTFESEYDSGSPLLLQIMHETHPCEHVNRMPRNRLPRVMKHYSPTGRSDHGRALKRLLDT